MRCTISEIYFDKELYVYQTDLYTVFTLLMMDSRYVRNM